VDAVQAIVLGIVQGLTEFLPVSSTAHLRIVPAFFGWEDPGAAFTAVVQLGTMAAVLVYFRRELWAIAVAWVRSVLARERAPQDPDARLGWYIVLGTIPIGILGLAFKDPIENEFRTLELVGSALIVFSFVMLQAEAVSKRDRDMSQLTRRDGLIIGCAQALALVPGVSRSGATISAGLFLNFDRTTAVVLSGLFELRHVGEGGGASAGATALATVLAFVVGYLSIAFLLRYLVRHSIAVFAAYRVVLGIAVLSLAAAGVIN
jgi:undecaprenyl-diphosphatase